MAKVMVEAWGTMGFGKFFVVTKFKTLLSPNYIPLSGQSPPRCILLPWVIKQKLSDNEALGSPLLLLERERGRWSPAPAAAGLSAPAAALLSGQAASISAVAAGVRVSLAHG